jgi:hypothetical protein
MLRAMLARGWVDVHSADRILDDARFVRGRQLRVAHAGTIPPQGIYLGRANDPLTRVFVLYLYLIGRSDALGRMTDGGWTAA